MRFFVRFVLLAIGFALFTYGLLKWSADSFTLTGLLPFTEHYRTQGLHFLMLGLAMIPPSLWEIFNLERQARSATAVAEESTQAPPDTAKGSSSRGDAV